MIVKYSKKSKLFIFIGLCMLITTLFPSLIHGEERSEIIDIATGWEIVDFQTNLSNIDINKIFIQDWTNEITQQKAVISNFGNIGDAEFTAVKKIPMKKGYTYKFSLIYGMLFKKGTAYIDFNGEQRIVSGSDAADQILNKKMEVIEDSTYIITIHYEVQMGGTGYLKLGYSLSEPGVTELKNNLKVIVHYKDEKGNMLAPDTTLVGTEEDPYTAEEKKIPNYIYERVEGEPTGIFKTENQEVSYIYKDNRQSDGHVIVHYKDEKGNTLAQDTTLTGPKGSRYSTEKKEIPNFTCERVEGDALGTFSEQTQEVSYIYKENSVTDAKVTVHFVDEEGNTLQPDVTMIGAIDDSYKTEPKVIDGYELKETLGEAKGLFSKPTQEVTYVYKKTNDMNRLKIGDNPSMNSLNNELPDTGEGLGSPNLSESNQKTRQNNKFPSTGEHRNRLAAGLGGVILSMIFFF